MRIVKASQLDALVKMMGEFYAQTEMAMDNGDGWRPRGESLSF